MADIEIYREDILDYFNQRREFMDEYPGTLSNLKPKHHFLVHYPSMVVQHGPLRMYWTLRWEAKHRLVVNIMEAAKNFKNTPSTITYRGQLRLPLHYMVDYSTWMAWSPLESKFWGAVFLLQTPSFHSRRTTTSSQNFRSMELSTCQVVLIFMITKFVT